MAEASEKLAKSLEQLKQLQDTKVVAIRSKELSRTHRERLVKNGFIREVIKGWYIPSRPDEQLGDSTSWYTSFWDFSANYLNERFGHNWCLSAEQSLNLHIGDRTVPAQLLIRSSQAGNKPTELLFETSFFDVRQEVPASHLMADVEGLQVYSLAAALVYCGPRHFAAQPTQLRTALAMIKDASEVLTVLLEGGHSVIAGRLAGAFRNIGRNQIAAAIIKGMQAADYTVNETDPFEDQTTVKFGREVSPYVNRIKLMWNEMRETVIRIFEAPADTITDVNAYLESVDNIYVTDAYHSLSIEGYRVTLELIDKVRSGDWQPELDDKDKKHLDALAAKGYWDAFQQVKTAIESVLGGANPGQVFETTHSDWYLALFGPSVVAGIVKQTDLAGYRSGPVYIRQSKHVPPSKEAVRDMLPALFELLSEEEHPAVRVVLGHFFFVFIHPYYDGNGRMGRFIMNLMMAAGGYSWTVIPVEKRNDYMAALEAASVDQNIEPFAQFIYSLIDGFD